MAMPAYLSRARSEKHDGATSRIPYSASKSSFHFKAERSPPAKKHVPRSPMLEKYLASFLYRSLGSRGRLATAGLCALPSATAAVAPHSPFDCGQDYVRSFLSPAQWGGFITWRTQEPTETSWNMAFGMTTLSTPRRHFDDTLTTL
jgi:hypothetical protein